MDRILVTGGAGFIGSHTVDALIKIGYDVVVLDNLQKPVHLRGKPNYLNPKAEYIWGDVRKKNVLEKALSNVHSVFHFAAYQDYLPDFSTFFHVNSVGTALLYEIIVESKLPIKKVIVASSQAVNGEGLYKCKEHGITIPDIRSENAVENGIWDHKCPVCSDKVVWQWTPETVVSPQNQYAMSKYTQELMAISFGERYSIPSVALRYSIVQGSRQSFYNAYSGACRIFSLSYFFDKAPILYEDGLMCRDFINIHDVVRANLLILENNNSNNQVYCIGSGKSYTVKDFAIEVGKTFDREDLKPIIKGEYRFGDTRNACSDISKIKKLGWIPEKDIKNSIREYRAYLEEQLDIDDILKYTKKQMKKMNVVRKVKKKK